MGEERIVTVGELIEVLSKMPLDKDVVMRFVHPWGTEAHRIESVRYKSPTIFKTGDYVELSWCY